VASSKHNGEPWHTLDREEMGGEVSSLIRSFKDEQGGRRTRYVRNLELYEGRTMGDYSARSYMGDGVSSVALEMDRLRLVRSAVSHAVSSIYAPQKPKPQFQTIGATWEMRRKAYRLDRICEGILNQRQGRWINVWAFMADAAVDAALQGAAAIKVVANTELKRIDHKLVPLPDLFVDPAEGRNPLSLFQREPVDAEKTKKQWPKAAAKIDAASPYSWDWSEGITSPRAAKVVELQYAWRLPISADEPGRWCAVINGEVLEEGEWTAPAFPFVFLLWEPHRDGFWASGIADEGSFIAENCGVLDDRLMIRELIASKTQVFYEKESIKGDDLALNDAYVAIAVEKGAMPPVVSQVPAFAPQDIQFKDGKVREFWDAIGISQVSAAARREQGLSSGIAIMTLNDTKAGRQLIKAQRYEQAYVDLAHQYVWRLRELAAEDPDFAIRWPGKALLRTVKFADNDIEDEAFSVSVAPSSALPHDPAGRQEMVQQMYRSGLISQETARSLIGWADIDSELNVENAELEFVDLQIERYLDAEQDTWDAGEYIAPEGYIFNKIQALRRFTSALFRARIDQAFLPREEREKAEFNISLLTRFIQELDGLIKAEMAPPPGPPAADQVPAGTPSGPAPGPDQMAAPPRAA